MTKKIALLEGVNLLSKSSQKKVKAGNAGPCGVRINGVWYESVDINFNGRTKDDALGAVANGAADAWCCASCPWN